MRNMLSHTESEREKYIKEMSEGLANSRRQVSLCIFPQTYVGICVTNGMKSSKKMS